MIGTRRTRPGPAEPFVTRPRVKITSRSYWRTMLIVLQIRKRSTAMPAIRIASRTGSSMARDNLSEDRWGQHTLARREGHLDGPGRPATHSGPHRARPI